MKKISLIIICIMFFVVFPILSVSAHSSLLNVEYDECSWVVENNQDDEKWYILKEYHINENISTIKYYISNNNLVRTGTHELGHVFGLNDINGLELPTEGATTSD